MTWKIIPPSVKNVWEKWNIRGVILSSLTLQIILIIFSPLRKRTQRSFLVWSLWSAYLFADWAANFCVGLISNNQKDENPITRTSFLLAFWTPFLLLHLGGPDTITAFALEDNELWLRHLLGLFFQVVAAAYVFLLTLPDNTLWIPTLLVFLAGIIKYAERTRALYLASINTFRQSMVRDPDPGPNYAKLMEEYFSKKESGLPSRIVTIGEQYPRPISNVHDTEGSEELKDVEVVQHAYDLFDKFKGLIADMIFSISDRDESREFFHGLRYTDALRVIEVELNFIYEIFYTKVSVVRNKVGYFLRFVSFSSVVAAMALFISEDKHGFKKFDVGVTYTLLYGALGLDFIALFMLIFSDRTLVSTKKSEKKSFMGVILKFDVFKQYLIDNVMVPYLSIKRPKWSPCKEQPYTKYHRLSTRFAFRRWSGSMSGYNFIVYCLDQCPKHAPPINGHGFRFICQFVIHYWFKILQCLKALFCKFINYIGAKDLLETWKYKEKKPFLEELWKFIFGELQRKSKDAGDVESAKKICSARGEYVWEFIFDELRKRHKDAINGDLEDKVITYVNSNKVTFDESLMLWHIATHLCYEEDNKDCDERHFSKLISDYMLYLLIMQPTMMSSIAGIGQMRFQDTCAEAIKFFSKRDLESEDEENANEGSQQRETRKERRERRKKMIVKAACEKLLEVPTEIEPVSVKGDRSKSVLFDACRLAKELKTLPEDLKWKSIAQIWVEILSYAATNCRPTTHVQQVSKGGELISFVWLLMVHLGLGTQFQIKEGHARAKLIVKEEIH
ncbi:hypothetical protein L6164_012991 [Bauhinia variegata]|uniref:Uncharacterized protein n=1 Tax=Bauhinia variegata TaxID=167791 RepID=A0ACB9PH79_BAUVA|nr:hypothetical protein L6164_012991 [Bauhinia variegata]